MNLQMWSGEQTVKRYNLWRVFQVLRLMRTVGFTVCVGGVLRVGVSGVAEERGGGRGTGCGRTGRGRVHGVVVRPNVV